MKEGRKKRKEGRNSIRWHNFDCILASMNIEADIIMLSSIKLILEITMLNNSFMALGFSVIQVH